MPYLTLLSDLIFVAATVGMALWCRVLTKRLRAFNDLEKGLSGTIAAMSTQVDDLKASISAATAYRDDRLERLEAANSSADDRIGRMEMLMASLEELEQETADRLLSDAEVMPDSVPSFRAMRPVQQVKGNL
ncbi:hypothetical protein [Jannaschia pohangensis]|uniref:Uncharacterized protein n=1 Tax=Jannaschia pohangensis TaxID=390807 RepID=A0A1I3RAK4_9RHOB|nr:hypothetical protein [Jannaschia pohangensis]SFJ42216.1 hypothetical protein SAMN04488095_2817 [Jannaschia pohangensis]